MGRNTKFRKITALALFTTLLLPTASFAEGVVHRDARRDVFEFSPRGIVERPSYAAADVTRFAAHHRARAVTMRVAVRDLAPRPLFTELIADVVTPDQTYRVYVLRWKRKATRTVVVDADDATVRCARAQGLVSAARDLVLVSIPRSCLDNPAWVRVGAVVTTLDADDKVFADDMLTSDLPNLVQLPHGPRLSTS